MSSPPPLSSLPKSATQLNPPPQTTAAIHPNIFHLTSRLTIASGLMFLTVVCALMISFLFIFHYYHQRLRQYQTRVHDIESRFQSSHISRVLAEFQSERARRWAAEEEGSAATTIAFREIKTGEVADCDGSCAICIEGFGDEEICRVIESCGHFFHKDCADQWLRIESRCPLCRCFVENRREMLSLEGL